MRPAGDVAINMSSSLCRFVMRVHKLCEYGNVSIKSSLLEMHKLSNNHMTDEERALPCA